MVESDQSDKETQDKVPALEVSNDSMDNNESTQKRLREETSEDEKLHLPSKKLCISIDKTSSEEQKIEHIPEVNGTVDDVKKGSKDINVPDNKSNMKNTSKSEENTGQDTKETYDAMFENKSEEVCTNIDIKIKTVAKTENLTDSEQKDNTSMEYEANVHTKEKEMEEGEHNIKRKKKHAKTQIEDAEVVEGLELSVECASDKESSSSSENEDERDKKPKPKTIIVKAKPNDSELDVSSTEAEKSDSQDASEIKSKQRARKGKKKSRTSFSKTKNTDSEENDNVSDEDYSPRTKRKLKKTVINKKAIKSPSESKKGRGRGKKVVQKVQKEEEEDGEQEEEGAEEEEEEKEEEKVEVEVEDEEEEEEDENQTILDDKKTEENLSDIESLRSKSENESDSENASKDEKRRGGSIKPNDDKRIQVLKKYIRTAGIHVKSYNNIWVGCKSNAARIRCLKELLEKHGVTGRPTLEKCKKAKERNERLKDIAELNTSNIISEGRVTRAQRNKDSSKEPTKTSETPTKHREARNTLKRVLRLIDSDSE